MRCFHVLLFAGVALAPLCPAAAADALKFGPPPAWVTPKAIPDSKPTDAPVALLLNDQQVSFAGGKITTFSEVAFRIQTSQGLAAGNPTIVWQPATDTVTVHKLQIHRGGKIIDVLANGQTFTVLRRETNLDAATLDGALTATIQPEGLQQGDVLDLATTIEHSDPVLKGHVEAIFAGWNGTPIELGYASVTWPNAIKVAVRQSGALPAATKSVNGGQTRIELTAQRIEPVIAPAGAPKRFAVGRLAEATDFGSWGDVADLMMPLYRDAAAIPASGPLHEEVERIRAASADPKTRAEQALSLVQDRVRYVALLMGSGGYVPATAETTWSRRFGDCKAKTALLLGILHSLGIEAEPVLVQTVLGDMVADRLPMISLFNHVLVRAHVGGKTYWLDGTRTGDTTLDDIRTPNFGWGLPLLAKADLVHMVPAPLEHPDSDGRIDIDASAGVLAPATISISSTFHGDGAVALNAVYAQLSAAQRDDVLRKGANDLFDNFTVSTSSIQFDKAARELTVTQKGTAKLSWNDGWFSVPETSLGFDPDLQRAAGPQHDAPFTTNYPNYDHRVVTIHLPQGFAAGQQQMPAAVSETLLGVEYRRAQKLAGDVLTIESSERSLVPEVPYKVALTDEPRLRKLNDDDVYLRLPEKYRASSDDIKAELSDSPRTAKEYFNRGLLLLNSGRLDEAVADFTEANKLDPKDVWALANRAMAYALKQDMEAAERDVAAAEKLDADNAVALRAQGVLASSRGDFKAAIDAFSKSLQFEPKNQFALERRAAAYYQTGDDTKALADTESALALGKNPDLRIARANILLQKGERELVETEADALTRDNPESSYAWVGAAKIYSAVGQRAKAMHAMDRALAIKPEAYIYINRSQVRPQTDRSGRIADLDAALKLEPDSEDALVMKAQLLSEDGDNKGALALLDRIKPSSGDHWADEQRALVLFKMGRTAEAEKLFQSARAAAKGATQLNNLCWIKATAGVMLESALQDCRDALKLSPGAGGYLDSLAMVLLKLGRLDEALDAYNQAVTKKTGAASLMGRAFVFARKGDTARAKADAAAARQIDADIDATFATYGLRFDAAVPASAVSRTR